MLLSKKMEIKSERFILVAVVPSILYGSISNDMKFSGKQTHDRTHESSDSYPASENFSGMNILLVEDNQINQQLAQEILQEAGATVTIANNGQEALNCLNDHSFDLVLMDVQMPVMDGYQATQAIRNEMGLTDLPIIAMTAHAMESDQEKCLEAGMNDYIAKPVELDQLFSIITRWIDLE